MVPPSKCLASHTYDSCNYHATPYISFHVHDVIIASNKESVPSPQTTPVPSLFDYFYLQGIVGMECLRPP